MREHQIVITLKPDQFLEVQRLARAANAKSMGVFVRQKLLAALGIEGAAAEALAASGGSVDVEAVLADLQRVHAELRGFVAESLSPYAADAFVEAEPEPSQQLSLFQEESEVYAPHVVPELDELEKVAEKTFAISPRLGSIETPVEPTPEPIAEQPVAEQPIAEASVPELLTKHELHSRRDIHRSHHGDPLSKLLKEEEGGIRPVKARVESDPDDDTFDVPLSIAERRRQLAAAREASVEESPDHSIEEAIAPVAPVVYQTPEETALEPAPEATSVPAPVASQPPQPAKNETGRPLGYPPLSGSPPPKRRQV